MTFGTGRKDNHCQFEERCNRRNGKTYRSGAASPGEASGLRREVGFPVVIKFSSVAESVTVELIEQLMKHTACTHDPIHDLLRTPAMKKHLTPVARKFGLMGFDVRTKEQKAEDERRADEYRSWTIRQLASRYDREKIYEEIWLEPIQHVAKRYDISDVGLAKVCKKLNIPRPGRGYWAMKAAGKAIPKRPPLPELFT